MTFVSDKGAQQRFNTGSHRRDPRWAAGRPVRGLLIFLCIAVPAVLMLLTAVFRPFGPGVPMDQALLLALLFPELILLPITIIRCKNDRHCYRCVSAGRYGDSLLLAETELVYTFRDLRDPAPSPQYEIVVPYRLIREADLMPRQQTLMLHAGGTDTTYDSQGRVKSRIHYLTGDRNARSQLRWVEIPLTYPDNELFLRHFEAASGVQIRTYDETSQTTD